MQVGRKWFYGTAAVAVVAVVGSGVGLYFKLSSRAAPDATPHGPMATAPAAQQGTTPAAAAPSMEVAADRLALRLKEKGGTGDDWALLARSYVHLKRYPEAVEAYAKALEKMPGNQAFIDGQTAARNAAAGTLPAR